MTTDPTTITKPVPVPTKVSEPYWSACREGRLVLQYCPRCEEYLYYPRSLCGRCNGDTLEWRQASGQGSIYSFSVVHRAPDASFKADVPYVVALVDLDEGVRMMSSIVGDAQAVTIGARVAVEFEERDSQPVPVFRPSTYTEE